MSEHNKRIIKQVLQLNLYGELQNELQRYIEEKAQDVINDKFSEDVDYSELSDLSRGDVLEDHLKRIGNEIEVSGKVECTIRLNGFDFFEESVKESILINIIVEFMFYYIETEKKYTYLSMTNMYL